MARRKRHTAMRRRPPKARHTVADYMRLRDQADATSDWPTRRRLHEEADRIETELLRRGEYHRRKRLGI